MMNLSKITVALIAVVGIVATARFLPSVLETKMVYILAILLLGILIYWFFHREKPELTEDELIEEAYNTLKGLELLSQISLASFRKRVRETLVDFEGRYGKQSKEDFLSHLKYVIHELLEKHKSEFTVDWKWAAEDILFNIHRLVPNLNYKIEKEAPEEYQNLENLKEWFFVGTVNNQSINIKGNFGESPRKFIDRLNPIIAKLTKKKFVEYWTGDDSYGFILVPQKHYENFYINPPRFI